MERRGPAALLTIDRPHAGNSISAEVTTALDGAISALEGDRELVAIVIETERRPGTIQLRGSHGTSEIR